MTDGSSAYNNWIDDEQSGLGMYLGGGELLQGCASRELAEHPSVPDDELMRMSGRWVCGWWGSARGLW